MESSSSEPLLLLDNNKLQRFHDLLQRFIDLSDTELAELKELRALHHQRLETRSQEIAAIREQIRLLKLEPQDVFDREVLEKLSRPAASSRSARRRPSPTPQKKWRKSDSAPVLLEMKPDGGRGRAFVYRKGRIYEGMSPNKPEPVYASLPGRLQQYGSSSKQILDHLATPEGRQYFSTAEGRAELEKIVSVVQQAAL